MRILRNLVYISLIVVGIVLASVNMTPVRFLYIPSIPFLGLEQTAEAEIPLALLLLAFLLVGAFIAGTGTFVEHLRLRFLVRRNEKVVKALRADLDKAKAALETAEATLVARGAELSSEQARAKKAEENEVLARREAEQERLRADEAVRQLLPPAEVDA